MPSELVYADLDKIRVNPVALRDVNRESEDFMMLVQSVKDEGVLLPISIRRKKIEPDDGKEFELVDGLQRFSAAQEAGSGVRGSVGVIPAQVVERDEAEALITQVVANAHRIETKPAEYARALMRILGYNPTMSTSELSAKLNKPPQWVEKQLGLLKLSDEAKPLVDDGKIKVTAAFALAKLPKEEQNEWLERAMTLDVGAFSTQALERVKQIRDANRKGENAGDEQYVAIPHIRKKSELENEADKGEQAQTLVRSAGILEQAKNKEEAAIKAFQLALKWALSLDEDSQQKARGEWQARKKKQADDKAKRDAEKQAKRAAEVKKKSEEAAKEAQKAREAAEARGVNVQEGTPAAV